MNDPRVLFVKKFLAALLSDDVSTIPLNNELFESGMDEMAGYFNKHREMFGPFADKLELLFLKYSIRGEYSQFSKVIESFNGRLVSLENPHYVKANLKLEEPYVEELVHNDELGLKPTCMDEMVRRFCTGAQLAKSGVQ